MTIIARHVLVGADYCAVIRVLGLFIFFAWRRDLSVLRTSLRIVGNVERVVQRRFAS